MAQDEAVNVRTIRIPVQLRESLRRLAFERDVSQNTLIVEGIEWRVSHARVQDEAEDPGAASGPGLP